MFAQLLFALALLLLPGDVFGGTVRPVRRRGGGVREGIRIGGRKDSDGRGCFMGGGDGVGQQQ